MKRTRRQAKFYHGLLSCGLMMAFTLYATVWCGTSAQLPLIFGCAVAGLIALWLGYSWQDIVASMEASIAQAMEATLILLLIGVLIAAWVCAGTVPAIIYYGLRLLNARTFALSAMLVSALISLVSGSWGAVGTVGTAFMGIGQALGVSPAMTAGAILSGAYAAEMISPLSGAANLAAAMTGQGILPLCKRTLLCSAPAIVIAALLYGLTGRGAGDASSQVAPLLAALESGYRMSPLCLLPFGAVMLCILCRIPAMPSILAGAAAGIVQAVVMQGARLSDVLTACAAGCSPATGYGPLDTLLSTGGLTQMADPVIMVVLAMAYGGLMQSTGQMGALVEPVLRRLRSAAGLFGFTEALCVVANVLLPDQYLSITVPSQLCAQVYDRQGVDRLDLACAVAGSGIMTSPLVPWNTCGIYVTSVLGVQALSYLPYAWLNLLAPVVTLIVLSLRLRRTAKTV